ncbi:uncharacterized protein LOC120104572 [Phoenix dactylifera]|uniref:Uncharacterized protein LOC120104572 n=1 Tax=Phoenix dactylifera TaxID=42345 RepID=A0A8B8ZJF9_PHODC|nr:uncharacterized protein LOC120104572 [Phoenix dactylifera]
MVVSEPEADPWVLCGVYASTDYRVRRPLWHEITSLLAQGIPTVAVGDFNCIQSADEKRGGAPFTDRIDRREFRDFVQLNGLVDLGFSGPRFTWCNNQPGGARVWERLDRAFASPDWILRFPTCRVSHLPRIASDHCPLLISTSSVSGHHSPFRFEKIWLSYPQSWDIVREAWRVPVRGDAMRRVSRKLELTKRRLRRWNREVVGDIFRRLEGVEEEITTLQEREDLRGALPEDDMSHLRGLLATHHSLLRQHEIFWRQKSRVQWVNEGDRNTRFFHRTTVIRRQRSMIHSLRDGSGRRVEGEPAVGQVLLDFFRARWTEDEGPGADDHLPRADVGITDDENMTLVRPVSAEEVQEAVWALAADKAPGPDGFPPIFFRRYWGIIREAVIEAVQCFFTQAAMPEDWKATFITLIPKRQEAVEPGHFRPISLCTTLYKVVARIMVGRMKPLLPSIISQEQGAFIAGRNISHNVMLAQEMMWDLQRASKRGSLMAVKLDMERAYDRIRWSFLRRVLEAYGFHRRWIGWILGCVQGPKFSILVNGTPSVFFESTMGLRQGCPLSPYLFIICSDILSRALQRACASRELESYVPTPGAGPVSHLLFADDCLLLSRARVSEARVLRRVLAAYCAASGQRINFTKSAIQFSPSTESRVRQEIRSILQMPEQEGTLVYLGVPITGRRLRVAECSGLVQRVESRLEGWRASSLSMMGRLTLVRSVLGSMPVYLMANTVVPKTTLLKIERLLRSFLWGSHGGGRGVHLVAWERVCRPTSEGGLGVQSLLERRETLIARHAARFLLEPHGLWSRVMAARYGRGSLEAARRGRRISFMWREIGRYLPTVLAHTRWLMGDGRTIVVTDDPWVDTIPLRYWPTTVDFEAAVGLRVCDLLAPGRAEWDVDRLYQLFGAHLAERILAMPVPGCEGPDVRVWSTSCRASVRLGDLARVIQREHESGWDGAWIWRSRLHPRAALFLWKVMWDRLPTRAVLSRRGLGIPAECGACGADESVDHVLFGCLWARQTWQWTGIPEEVWRERRLFLQMIRQWLTSPRTCQEAIRAICTAHQIWLARNARTFGERRMSPSGTRGGAGFVIRDPHSRVVAAGGCRLFDTSVPAAELRAAWAGLCHARRVLGASSIILEGDSSTVIGWIRRESIDHPLIRDIRMMMRDVVAFEAKHVFREANGAADWVAAYAAHHSGYALWAGERELPLALREILYFDVLGCIRTRAV